MTQPTLEQALSDFLSSLSGKNRSAATIRAYQTGIHQCIMWLHENNMVVVSPAQVERADITDYRERNQARLAAGRRNGVRSHAKNPYLLAKRSVCRLC